jgi:hypothetical protein
MQLNASMMSYNNHSFDTSYDENANDDLLNKNNNQNNQSFQSTHVPLILASILSSTVNEVSSSTLLSRKSAAVGRLLPSDSIAQQFCHNCTYESSSISVKKIFIIYQKEHNRKRREIIIKKQAILIITIIIIVI